MPKLTLKCFDGAGKKEHTKFDDVKKNDEVIGDIRFGGKVCQKFKI